MDGTRYRPQSGDTDCTPPPSILALDDEKPIELFVRGEHPRVAKLIAELEYPGVS